MPKMLPTPSPESQRYWDGCTAGELWLQRCTACDGGAYFPPSSYCPRCLSTEVEWYRTDGHATLHSYLISHRAAPGYEHDTPYAIAIVQLDDGPRMMSNIVGIPITPEDLVLDMELTVAFEERGDGKVPVFTPVAS